MAGVAIARQLRNGRELRPYRIEVNVMAKLPEGTTRLYKQALVARLKKVAALASRLNRFAKVACSQLHSGHEIFIRRFEGQVKRVSHYYERMKQPVAPAARLEKTVLKCLLRTIALKYPTAVISAVDKRSCSGSPTCCKECRRAATN
jgi:hypothetical protein